VTAPQFVAPDEVSRRRPRGRLPSWARRSILATVVGGLVVANAFVYRRQNPGPDREKNEAYDQGLLALHKDRDFVRAEAEFRRYLAVDERSTRVRHLLGVALQYQRKSDDARREYARVLEQDPDFDEARIALAEMAQEEQAYEEAWRELELAAANDPTPTAVHVLRARLLVATGDQDGAVAAYRETLRRDPDSYESAIELGDLLMARSLLGGAVADRQAAAAVYHVAEDVLRTRLATTQDKRLRLLLAKSISGQARVLQQRQLGEAVIELRKAAELDPDDPEPTLLLGQFFRAAGNLEEAGRILEDARRKWPTRPVAVALHELYADQKRVDDALAILRGAVEQWVDDAGLRVRLVAYLVAIGRLDDAEKEADAAQQLFAQDDRVHATRGDLARERAIRAERDGDAETASRRRAETLAAYRRALELRPKSIRLKKLVAGELIEGLLRKAPGAAPSPDEVFARRCIEDVLRVNARDAEALGWRARLLLVDGRYDEVVKSLRPVLATAAPPLETLRILGAAASRLAEWNLAADAFARVVDLQRDREREKAADAVGVGPSAEDWWNALRAALDAGRDEAAIEMGVVAARLQPKSVDVRAELGAAYLAKGDGAAALKTLRAARGDFPTTLVVRLLLARAYETAGRADAAEDELKTAIIDLPGEPSRRAYFEFLARSGRTEAAEQGFLAMTASDPTSPVGWLRLGDFYLSLKPPRLDAALAQYEKALELTHGGAPALLRIAELRLGVAVRDAAAFADAETAVAAFAKAAPNDPWKDYLAGKLALAGGRPAEASPLLAKFIEKVPTSPAGLYYYAHALHAEKRVEEALDAMERAAKLSRDGTPPTSDLALDLAALRYEAGKRAFAKGDYSAAQRLLAAAEAGGAGRGAKFLLAGAHANAGELDVSEKECRKLLADDPANQAGVHLLAELLLHKGDLASLREAESLFRRALDIDANDVGARFGIGLTLFERGDYRNALESFRAVYPKMDGAPSVAMAIAQCMVELHDAAGAAEFFDAEIKARPDSATMRHLKGDFLVYVKQPRDAVREFVAAYDLDPDDTAALLAAAAALLQAREHDAARKLLMEKLPKARQPGLVRLALGETLLLAGRPDDAGEELRQSLAQVPGHPRALYLLGRIAENAGKKADAKRLYRESVQHGAVDADAYARLAQLAASEGDRREAIDMYDAAAKREPRNVPVLNNLARLLGDEEGRLDEAIERAKIAAALAPDMPEIADTLGWLLFRAGRATEAAQHLETAANRLKTNAVVQYHAGMALSRVSRTLDARNCLERALRIDATFPGADAARAEIERLK
jgi:tetratricopeptide (TPR) repeat protein